MFMLLQESEEERTAREERLRQLEAQLSTQDDKLTVVRLERELETAQDATVRLHAQIDLLQVPVFNL